MATLQRIDPAELKRRLENENPPVVLDARRHDAFVKFPEGITGAIPIVLDRQPLQLPDLLRTRSIVAYCL